ncbi:MAG: hypothetical protein V3U82_01385 [Robiginitomaculum sp.]
MSIFSGVIAALAGKGFRAQMDTGRTGFMPALIALGLTVPLYLFCAYGAAQNSGVEPGISAPVLTVILTMTVFTAPMVIYLISYLISAPERFRPWMIVRSWAVFGLAIIMALGFALFLGGLAPFKLAYAIALVGYIASLLVDIRLAQTAAQMNPVAAVLIGCAIAIASLLVMLAGFASVAGY